MTGLARRPGAGVARCAGAVLLALALPCAPVWADSPARPYPYAQVVGTEQQWLLVMLPGGCARVEETLEMPESEVDSYLRSLRERRDPQGVTDDGCRSAGDAVVSGRRGGVVEVRVRRARWRAHPTSSMAGLPAYPVPGLYPNDGSTEPLWAIDWYAFGVHPGADGEHLVRMGPWAGSVEDLAVAFYERGRLLRRYAIKELVSDPGALPRSVSHFQWRERVAFDAGRKVLLVHTLSDDRHVFDASTGERLLSHRGDVALDGIVRASGASGAPEQALESLTVCWSEDLLIGRTAAPPAGRDALAVLALRDLATLERVTGSAAAPAFRARLRDGGERRIRFPGAPPALCGMDADGLAVEVALDRVQRLELR